MIEKQTIRKAMFEKRNSLDAISKEKQTQNIIRQIKQMETYKNAKSVSIFYPLGNEIDLRELKNDDKIILLPKIENKKMVFYIWTDETKFNISKFGVSEPISGDVFESIIDFMIVPALAISKDKYRIGYGKGYYDQYIFNNKPKLTVGVIYDFQELDEIPHEKHDQKLDLYIKGSL